MVSDDPLHSAQPAAVPAAPSNDAEHLKLLAVFHFLYAALVALGGCCAGGYIVMGLLIASGEFEGSNGPPPPPEMGWFFVVFGAFGMLLIWGMAVLVAVAGRKLLQRRGRVFCMVIAGFMCVNFPIGTALGVFTLIVLSRPSVKLLFESA